MAKKPEQPKVSVRIEQKEAIHVSIMVRGTSVTFSDLTPEELLSLERGFVGGMVQLRKQE